MIYFLSILNDEFIKIGFTEQKIEKRRGALQTGNPHEIKVLFTIDGTLKQEKEIHRVLGDVFSRVRVFSNPVNEWYSGSNPIIKMFLDDVVCLGIDASLQKLRGITCWDAIPGDKEIFSVRSIEKALRGCGLSLKEAKTVISKNKSEWIDQWNSTVRGKTRGPSVDCAKRVDVVLRKGPMHKPQQVQIVTGGSL